MAHKASLKQEQPMNYKPAKTTNWHRFQDISKVVGANLILLVVVTIALYPVVMMVINSFKSDAEISWNPASLPVEWTLDSYAAIFQQGGLILNLFNSILIAVTSTLLATFLVGMAAFAFSKYRFKGRNVMFALLLATMMVPFEITIPPLYLMFAKIGWLNTYQVQIVPTITSVFGVFMLRQYMITIPDAIFEAAKIDGAGHWRLYWKIMVPISAPALGAFAIIHFLGVWNSYLWPLVVATKPAVQPIMVILPNLRDPHIGFLPVWGTIMAGCVLAVLPIVIVFILFQDKFMAGVAIGAVKE